MIIEHAYLLLELAVARRRSSMEVEDGKTPRLIRHCKPLRSPNCRLSGAADSWETAPELKGDGTDDDSGNGGTTRAGAMVIPGNSSPSQMLKRNKNFF